MPGCIHKNRRKRGRRKLAWGIEPFLSASILFLLNQYLLEGCLVVFDADRREGEEEK